MARSSKLHLEEAGVVRSRYHTSPVRVSVSLRYYSTILTYYSDVNLLPMCIMCPSCVRPSAHVTVPGCGPVSAADRQTCGDMLAFRLTVRLLMWYCGVRYWRFHHRGGDLLPRGGASILSPGATTERCLARKRVRTPVESGWGGDAPAVQALGKRRLLDGCRSFSTPTGPDR
jgi:hypothetical protein